MSDTIKTQSQKNNGQISKKKFAGGLKKEELSEKPFGKINFIIMGCCLALIILGFALMTGSGSSVENGYNPDIFSARRIVVGPTLAFIGFFCMTFGILWHPMKSKKKEN